VKEAQRIAFGGRARLFGVHYVIRRGSNVGNAFDRGAQGAKRMDNSQVSITS
jgi:hypothetical protein